MHTCLYGIHVYITHIYNMTITRVYITLLYYYQYMYMLICIHNILLYAYTIYYYTHLIKAPYPILSIYSLQSGPKVTGRYTLVWVRIYYSTVQHTIYSFIWGQGIAEYSIVQCKLSIVIYQLVLTVDSTCLHICLNSVDRRCCSTGNNTYIYVYAYVVQSDIRYMFEVVYITIF